MWLNILPSLVMIEHAHLLLLDKNVNTTIRTSFSAQITSKNSIVERISTTQAPITANDIT